MIELVNNTGSYFETTLPEKILTTLLNEHETADNVELVVVDDTRIRELNREYRDVDASTDVLSFPMDAVDTNASLGSIVVSRDHVEQAAGIFGHSNQEEFTLLFIHGMLHLLGYDHETDSGQMRTKEAQIIHQYSLPTSLICRTEEML